MTLERRLAATALALGALAVLGTPTGGEPVKVDTRELAARMEAGITPVTARELADWLVRGRVDFRLLDLRVEDAYAAYHIPTAERVSLAGLADHPLGRNEKIVVYSDDAARSAQGWLLLHMHGYPGAAVLQGDLAAWKSDVLFPSVGSLGPGSTPVERQAFEEAQHLSAHFGGTPVSASSQGRGGAGPAPAPAAAERMLPKVEAPTHVPVPTRVRRQRRGC